MIHGKKVVVVMPAYNAAKTLERTYRDIPFDVVDEVILTDDHSQDHTPVEAKRLGVNFVVHPRNRGYGGNQKTCYALALEEKADIVVMVHPDYQYTPKLIAAMASMIASEEYDIVLGSRILGRGALKGGMPLYKYISNRLLTLFQNLLVGQKLSEYHTGYRSFSSDLLRRLPLLENSDDFVFDNQMIVQSIWFGYRLGELSIPTRYMEDSSSINFRRSVVYGLGVIWTSLQFVLSRWKLSRFRFLDDEGRRIGPDMPVPPLIRNEKPAPD